MAGPNFKKKKKKKKKKTNSCLDEINQKIVKLTIIKHPNRLAIVY
jgi:hypothetical protein